jgi:hypothetical protein
MINKTLLYENADKIVNKTVKMVEIPFKIIKNKIEPTIQSVIKYNGPSKIIKNGKVLEPIPFIKVNFKKQITDDLLDFFNISFDLNSIVPNSADIRSSSILLSEQFFKKIRNNQISEIIKNEISIDADNLVFTDTSTHPSTQIKFDFIKNLQEGAFNTVGEYNYQGKSYIFREYRRRGYIDELFNCFDENLKHLILYIVMCRYNRQLKIIPQPFGMGLYDNKNYDSYLKDSAQKHIGFLSECGKTDLFTYMHTLPNESDMQMLCYQIYKELFSINSIPNMDLCFTHNDIKSENIVLTEDNYPLLIDFGLSSFRIDNIIFGVDNIKKCDRYYNLASEFFIFLYTINYHLYTFNISRDEKCIYNKITFNKIRQIINGNVSNSNLLMYGNLYRKQSANINIFADYIYKLTPTELLKEININQDFLIKYDREIYYKKYLKYKQKYTLLCLTMRQ